MLWRIQYIETLPTEKKKNTDIWYRVFRGKDTIKHKLWISCILELISVCVLPRVTKTQMPINIYSSYSTSIMVFFLLSVPLSCSAAAVLALLANHQLMCVKGHLWVNAEVSDSSRIYFIACIWSWRNSHFTLVLEGKGTFLAKRVWKGSPDWLWKQMVGCCLGRFSLGILKSNAVLPREGCVNDLMKSSPHLFRRDALIWSHHFAASLPDSHRKCNQHYWVPLRVLIEHKHMS